MICDEYEFTLQKAQLKQLVQLTIEIFCSGT